MTGLLLSVRDRAEALLALAAGVDLIDVKEPLRGSLGRPDAQAIAEVVATVARGSAADDVSAPMPVSVALGELIDFCEAEHTVGTLARVAFAKLGLAGCAADPRWPARWQQALETLPDHVGRVAVIYADWRAAGAPGPAAVLRVAAQLACRAVLVDTFDKRAGRLVDYWSRAEINDFIAHGRSLDMLTVVAGSLTAGDMARLLPLEPDYLAVRGAGCPGGRAAPVNPRRLAQLVELVRRGVPSQPARSSRCPLP